MHAAVRNRMQSVGDGRRVETIHVEVDGRWIPLSEAPLSEKGRILAALAGVGGEVARSVDLITTVGLSAHSIVHALYDMSRRGLVTFKQVKFGRANDLIKIRLTDAGWRAAP